MLASYIKLSAAALIPVLFSGLFYMLERRKEETPYGRLSYMTRQILIGVVFGGIAILGTEWGIPLNNAQVNCRDAAPLCAGLLFGAPAGIIAGVIGGLERWFAVYWGIGSFTRWACSISTMLAGLLAALLRKLLFEDKKPNWLVALLIGTVMEIFHVNTVIVTNANEIAKAITVVKTCALPMVLANGLSVMFATIWVTIIAGETRKRYEGPVNVSQLIQRGMLYCVLVCFVVTSCFMLLLQNRIADMELEQTLTYALDDVTSAVREAADEQLLTIAHSIDNTMDEGCDIEVIQETADAFGISEINLVDQRGNIYRSNVFSYLGYDMGSGEQSAEFNCLLDGETTEYVQTLQPISKDSTIERKYAGVATMYGYLQIGCSRDQFHDTLADEIQLAVHNRRVGRTGYMMVVDSEGNILFSTANAVLPDSVAFTDEREPYTVIETEVQGEKEYCMYSSAEGFYVIASLPYSEAYDDRDTELYVTTFMEILVFSAIFIMVYLMIRQVVVKNIEQVNQRLGEITGGDLNVVVDVRGSKEFSSLSDDINSTVDTLKRYIDEAAARIDKELEFAKSIQTSALPAVFAERADYDIFCGMVTAKEVGGDFYDFYHTDSDHLNVLIADVSGKGIPAAMFMMRGKTQLKSLTEAGDPVEQVFTDGNHGLCEGNDAGMFITAWQGCIDLNTGLVEFANAGHNPPIIRHANGTAEYLKCKAGLVLAGMDGLRYKRQTLQLQPGDVLFLYTDGVTEATSAALELYGEPRLLHCIETAEFNSMKELCAIVKAEVDQFVGEADQFDDITMVALRYLGRTQEQQ